MPSDFKIEELGKVVRMREFKIDKEENGVVYFKNGTYDKNSNIVKFTTSEPPFILDKMTKLHKASTNEPLFFLNIFFGLSLLFFCHFIILDVCAQNQNLQERALFYHWWHRFNANLNFYLMLNTKIKNNDSLTSCMRNGSYPRYYAYT